MTPIVFAGWIVLVALNTVSFWSFGSDKHRAISGHRRISERTFLTLALWGGWPGIYAGRSYFRHKTRKQPFVTRLAFASLANAVIVIGLATGYLRP